jgi:hypothetical protein
MMYCNLPYMRAAYGRDKQCLQQTTGASSVTISVPSSSLTKRTIHSSPLPPSTLSSDACIHPARQTLLDALEHALLPDLKGVFEAASPGRNVAVAFLNTSLNSFLPPLDVLCRTPPTSQQGAERLVLLFSSRSVPLHICTTTIVCPREFVC